MAFAKVMKHEAPASRALPPCRAWTTAPREAAAQAAQVQAPLLAPEAVRMAHQARARARQERGLNSAHFLTWASRRPELMRCLRAGAAYRAFILYLVADETARPMWAARPRAGVLSGAAAAAPKSARTGPDDLSPTRSDRFVPPFDSGLTLALMVKSACSGRVADKGREDGARVASPVGGERHAEQGHSCWRCFEPRQDSTRRAAEPAALRIVDLEIGVRQLSFSPVSSPWGKTGHARR